MINYSYKKLVQLALNNTALFSTHHQPTPTKLPKVSEVVINLYVKNKYGVVEKVPAFVGESILEAITRMKVHSFIEHCNGYDVTYPPHLRPHDNDTKGPVCGLCRIVFHDNWFQRVHEQTDGYNQQEEFLLRAHMKDLKSNTRLACCVPVEAWMEGLTCSVDLDPHYQQGGLLM